MKKMKEHKYRVKAKEITTHNFTILASDKDEAEEIAYDVLHGKATNEELDSVLDESINMNDQFTSRELKRSSCRGYQTEEME